MKIKISFLFIIGLFNAQIITNTKNFKCPYTSLSVDVNNYSNENYVFYINQAYFVYKIYNNNDEMIKKSFFIPFEDTSYYDFSNKFSKDKITAIMKKYSITEEQAVYFLEYTKTPILIKKNKARKIEQKFLLKSYCNNLPSGSNYYIKGTIYSQTEYFPKEYRDSLKSRKILILDSIQISKTKINF